MDKKFWKAAMIRMIKTMCETALAMIGTSTFIENVSWLSVLSATILSGIICLLTCLRGLPEV